MKIIKTSLYETQAAKLIKQQKLTADEIEDTEKLFLDNPVNYKLRPHKITCKKDKKRRSLTVINTSYRILYTNNGESAIFQQILSHRKYDRINKNC